MLTVYEDTENIFNALAAGASGYLLKRTKSAELLEAIRDRFGLRVCIEPDDTLECDRSLDGSAFENRTGIQAPSWPVMIDELYTDSQCYSSAE